VAAAADETAHLATTLVLLAACFRRPSAAFTFGALASAVLIDLDHVPIYLHYAPLIAGAHRPYTHSIATLGALITWAAFTRGRHRRFALGAAYGLSGHLVRDLGTGLLPLLWPLTRSDFSWSYAIYAGILYVGVGTALAVRLVDLGGRRLDRSARWKYFRYWVPSFRGRPAEDAGHAEA
jgi:inner membrane protein